MKTKESLDATSRKIEIAQAKAERKKQLPEKLAKVRQELKNARLELENQQQAKAQAAADLSAAIAEEKTLSSSLPEDIPTFEQASDRINQLEQSIKAFETNTKPQEASEQAARKLRPPPDCLIMRRRRKRRRRNAQKHSNRRFQTG